MTSRFVLLGFSTFCIGVVVGKSRLCGEPVLAPAQPETCSLEGSAGCKMAPEAKTTATNVPLPEHFVQ